MRPHVVSLVLSIYDANVTNAAAIAATATTTTAAVAAAAVAFLHHIRCAYIDLFMRVQMVKMFSFLLSSSIRTIISFSFVCCWAVLAAAEPNTRGMRRGETVFSTFHVFARCGFYAYVFG